MSVAFAACFDECGDEGFRILPPPGKASSEWFILSATIHNLEHAGKIRSHYAAYLRTHRKQQGWRFHFVKASHHERLAFIDHMALAPYTTMTVAVHKPSLTKRDAFSLPYRLYFYAARLLLERISWYCRDDPMNGAGMRHTTELIFAARRGLTEEDVRRYLAILRAQTDPDLSIHSIFWPAFDLKKISVRDSDSLISLQLADAVCSGIGQAIEVSRHGYTEHRYIKHLKPLLYRKRNTYLSYGIKFFPNLPKPMRAEPRFHWLKHVS